jgi:hypothetical protein
MQVANSHSHFRTRLNAANVRARLAPPATTTSRTMRSLQTSSPPADASSVEVTEPDDDDTGAQGYRQHSIHISDDDLSEDFEHCFFFSVDAFRADSWG